MSTADDLPLPLRVWPKEFSTDSLSYLISRINDQRGSFRNVTEEDLEEEIRAIKAGEAESKDDTQTFDLDDDPEPRSIREEIAMVRENIVKEVATAQAESAYALDFVSLLLSAHSPRQAEISMSPFLKQNVPMGSLGAEVGASPQRSDSDKRDSDLVITGWKIQSLFGSADGLLEAATRLETEMEKETKYWEGVLAVKGRGWSVCRLPRERHTLGVRYGFSEAAPTFRDRGLAALRSDPVTGCIDLDTGTLSGSPSTIRVRIQQRKTGKLIAVSVALDDSVDENGEESQSIEAAILAARNSLYDEELHHELHREARTMLNRGVKCKSEVIVLPLKGDREVLIDLVPTTDFTADVKNTDIANGVGRDEVDATDVKLATTIALSARMLLSRAHRQNLERRAKPPPPLTEKKLPRHIYSILRPILTELESHGGK